MTSDMQGVAAEIGGNLPYLRRYARALTGSQTSGDGYAAATLESILSDPGAYNADLPAKEALFAVFHAIWASTGQPVAAEAADTGLAAKARRYLERLTPNTREALLLRTIEEFSFEAVGRIMQIDTAEARDLVDIAYREMAAAVAGTVMIIEDESIIAMDLEGIVASMGHRVSGVARTEEGAMRLAERSRADLILSDIQLADNSSGIDAVNRIVAAHGDVPVIFITAFPERLLSGEGSEPAFLISKPYSEDQVRSAVSQAMFFSSTETLRA
ncbi:MAG: response regulator [Pseudomonadota bacterium]